MASATGSSSTSVDPSESASSEAATVGDGEATSGSKYEGAGDPSGVKKCLSTAIMPSSGLEGDTRRGGTGRGNDDDEEVGDSVVARDDCSGRNISRLIGSSPLSTDCGRGPFNLMA